MRVSVITIFLDEQRFLDEAVRSVLGQTHADLEYLLVDDGSSDGSSEIARRWAAADSRVRYLEHPGHANRGMSASRNLGIAHARGDLCAFLDGDDVWEPAKLARQVELFERDPRLDWSYGAPLYWHRWPRAVAAPEAEAPRDDALQEIGLEPGTVCDPPSLVARFLAAGEATPCTCDLIVRRAVVERVGGFVDEFAGMYEDQAFCTKLALAGRCVIGPPALSRYRQHADSCCATAFATGAQVEARRRFLDWTRRYLIEQRVTDRRIHRALRRQVALLEPPSGAERAVKRVLKVVIPASVRQTLRRWQSAARRRTNR